MTSADPKSTTTVEGDRVSEPSPQRMVVVGVEGSERSADALALADLLADQFELGVRIVHTHSYGTLGSILDGGHYESLVREVYQETFRQVQALGGEGRERDMHVISAESPVAGLMGIAEREEAELIVVAPRIAQGSAGSVPEASVIGCCPARARRSGSHPAAMPRKGPRSPSSPVPLMTHRSRTLRWNGQLVSPVR